ncbi:FAD-dependent monooxygenase [Aureimonas sp. ME7]|uniref:FAD-dependent monooxygenase n=1 Tax=Aureimonas sp. ME7 TaxID=2744252 RepID=UPI0015F47CD2|nr:FAD-dependent monooxygenase [Aureimonas sp. ME7]
MGEMFRKRILITGAGIAGPTLGYCLSRLGHRVTLLERAPTLRLSGQTVDIRDEGRDVISRMGILPRVEELMTNEDGLRFVDDDNRIRAEHPRAGGKKSFVTDIEILRADLSNLLQQITKDDVEYRYGDSIAGIHEGETSLEVDFAKAGCREFDLMIVAEGMRSRTRSMVFGNVPLKHIGLYTAYFAIPYEPQDGTWVRWHNCEGGKSILLRPDRGRSSRAYLYIRSDRRGIDLAGRERIVDFIRDTFKDDGWEAPRILRELDGAGDFFFEDLAQVRMGAWSKGRVALLGDAAYCATPVSGMGTTLAIVGAYVLASALAEHTDHRVAFARYEARMRPYAERAQAMRPWTIRMEQPSTRLGIRTFYALKMIEQTALGRIISGSLGPRPEGTDFLGPANFGTQAR